MATTKFTIATQALLKIGGNPISTFDGTDRESVVVSNMYEDTKKSLLYTTFWNFATQKTELAKLSETSPDANYQHVYQLPGDYIRVKGIFDTSGVKRTDYSVEKNKIFANISPLNLEYIQEKSESDFPPFFTEVLIAKLAYEICEAVTGVGTIQERLARDYQSKLQTARTVDGQENPPRAFLDEGRLIRARGGNTDSVIYPRS
tara:strand:- start:18265 stop:18873 length:609 start_codon:yes stop_codon:yes gene_type:complete